MSEAKPAQKWSDSNSFLDLDVFKSNDVIIYFEINISKTFDLLHSDWALYRKCVKQQ